MLVFAALQHVQGLSWSCDLRQNHVEEDPECLVVGDELVAELEVPPLHYPREPLLIALLPKDTRFGIF